MDNGTLTISVAGKTFGIRFGMQALMGISADGVFDNNDVKSDGIKAFLTAASITKMAWHGYLNWCLWMDEKTEISRQEFMELLDDAFMDDPSLYNKIVNLFQESKVIKKGLQEEKKIPQKKSK